MKTLNTIGIILLIITSLNALAAGFSMIAEPTGKDLGMTVDTILQHSPFHSFLIPGIVLFSTIGIGIIITLIAFRKKWNNYNLVVLAQGAIITGWIVIQVIFLRQFNWMHAVIGSIGLYTIVWGYMLTRLRKKFYL
jgi:hypothetical protein